MKVIASILLGCISIVADEQLSLNSSPNITTIFTKEIVELSKVFDFIDPSLIVQFDTDLNETQCNEDVKEIFRKRFTDIWAFNFTDATASIPDGIALGAHHWLGSYDECLLLKHPEEKFTGQYCVVKTNITALKDLPLAPPYVPLVAMLFYGICVPSTCPPSYLNRVIPQIKFPLLNDTAIRDVVTTVVDPLDCHTVDEKIILNWGDWVTIALILLIAILTILSTIYDLHQRFSLGTDRINPLYSSFSFYTNLTNLLKTETNPSQISCLHGIRAISMAYVVFGHLCMAGMYASIVNALDIRQQLSSRAYLMYNNAHQTVNTFFLLSSLLLVISFSREKARTGSYDFVLTMIKRYLRLTPAYAMVILFQVTLQDYLGSGPVYHITQSYGKNMCQKNWLPAILYYQNYLPPKELCLFHTWYLAADMQLFWLSPIFLLPAIWWPRLATAIAFTMAWVTTGIEFYVAYVNDLGPNVSFPPHNITTDHLALDHYPTHTRSAAWFVGLVLGFILVKPKTLANTFFTSKRNKILCWIGFMLIFGAAVFGLAAFDTTYSQPGAAIFLSFSRVAWAAGVSWIIYACHEGFGGFVDTILSWPIFQVFSKISYNVYLAHMPLIHYMLATSRDMEYINMGRELYNYIPIYVFSNLIAVVMTIFIEYPCAALINLMFKNVRILPLPWPRKKATQKWEMKAETTEGMSITTTIQAVIETDKNGFNDGNMLEKPCKERKDTEEINEKSVHDSKQSDDVATLRVSDDVSTIDETHHVVIAEGNVTTVHIKADEPSADVQKKKDE